MAKGKSTYAALICPETNTIIKTIRYLKGKITLAELAHKKFSKAARKRVVPKVKDIKKG